MIGRASNDVMDILTGVWVWSVIVMFAGLGLCWYYAEIARRWVRLIARVLLAAPLDSSLRTFWAQVFASLALLMAAGLAAVLLYDGEHFLPGRLHEYRNVVWFVAALLAALMLSAMITGFVALIHKLFDVEHASLSSDVRRIASDLQCILNTHSEDANKLLGDYVTVIDNLNRLCPMPSHGAGPRMPVDLHELEEQRLNGFEANPEDAFPRIHLCLTIDRSIPRLDRAISFQFQDRLKTWNNERYAKVTEDLTDAAIWKKRDGAVMRCISDGLIAPAGASVVGWDTPVYCLGGIGLALDQFIRRCCLRGVCRAHSNLVTACYRVTVPLTARRDYRIPRAIRLLTSSVPELLKAARAWVDAEHTADAPCYLREFPGLTRSGVLNVWLKDCMPGSMNVLAWARAEAALRYINFRGMLSPSMLSVIEQYCDAWRASSRIHKQLDDTSLRRMSEVYSGVTHGPADALAVGNQLFVLGLRPQCDGSETAGFLELLPVICMALNSKRAYIFDDLLAVITHDLRSNRDSLDRRIDAWTKCLYRVA